MPRFGSHPSQAHDSAALRLCGAGTRDAWEGCPEGPRKEDVLLPVCSTDSAACICWLGWHPCGWAWHRPPRQPRASVLAFAPNGQATRRYASIHVRAHATATNGGHPDDAARPPRGVSGLDRRPSSGNPRGGSADRVGGSAAPVLHSGDARARPTSSRLSPSGSSAAGRRRPTTASRLPRPRSGAAHAGAPLSAAPFSGAPLAGATKATPAEAAWHQGQEPA